MERNCDAPFTVHCLRNRRIKAASQFSDLPKTFQDAVIITREMCLRYLWINSLCIIQDSEADWNREASRMGTYHWNCQFNIAAADASDCTKGCFRQRHPATLGCRLDIKFPVGSAPREDNDRES